MRICGYRMLLLVWCITVLSVMAFGQAEPKGDYVSVNGERLWYRTEGRGAPLLLIPGGPGASPPIFGRAFPLSAGTSELSTSIRMAVASRIAQPIQPSTLLFAMSMRLKVSAARYGWIRSTYTANRMERWSLKPTH
jgi:hypothetical protein